MGYGIIPLGCAARCLGWQIGPLGCEISCLELQKKLDSPTRLAIMTHVSFHLMTEYCNSASLTCASKCRENIGTGGFCCLSRPEKADLDTFLSHFCFNTAGAISFVISHVVV